MWDMPPLVDHRGGGMIPPPAGAVMGGQPELHSAFPGFHAQQQQAQWPPAQGTPWAGGGGAWPAATPGPSWANTPAQGPSWANTPAQPSPWQQQHQQFQQQQTPGWAQAPMPRPGWGPAPQGAPPWGGHGGPSMPPEQWFRQPPPHGHADGFSAMAAPLESASGQPIGPSFFNGGGGGMPMHGMHGGGGQHWERDEEEEDRRRAWADHAERQAQEAEGHHQWAHWGPEQGHEPRPPAWAQDPNAGWEHEGAALMRTYSHGQHKSPGKKKKKRANSFSGGGWGTPAAFDEHHLSQRPEDWRDGYSPRGISGADISFSSLFRVGKKSDSKEWAGDSRKRTLDRVLTYNASRPNISYDLRRPPHETPFMGRFQPKTLTEFMKQAVTPPAVRMRLVHPRLPWYVDVVAQYHATGVTLHDVIRALFEELDRPIAGHDFWNEELGKRDRESLTRAFKERCAKQGEYMREEMLKGVKRVDFLGVNCVFVGLVRRNGMWEIRTDNDH